MTQHHRFLFRSFLPLLFLSAACSQSSDPSQGTTPTSTSEINEGDAFAHAAVKVTSLDQPASGSVFRARSSLEARPNARFVEFTGGCTAPSCMKLIDLDQRVVRDETALGVSMDRRGRPIWDISPNDAWIAFWRPQAAGALSHPTFLVAPDGDPSRPFEAGPAQIFTWAGRDAWGATTSTKVELLLLKTTTSVRAVRPKTLETVWKVDILGAGATNVPSTVTTPDGLYVLVHTPTEAKLVRADGTSIVAVDGWSASTRSHVVPAPSSQGFAVPVPHADGVHSAIRWLDRDGLLTTAAEIAREPLTFTPNGRLMYARPVDGAPRDGFGREDCDVVIHPEQGEDTVLRGVPHHEGRIEISTSGKWVFVKDAARGGWMFAPIDGGVPFRSMIPEAVFSHKEPTSQDMLQQELVFMADKTALLVVGPSAVPSGIPNRIVKLDLETSAFSEVAAFEPNESVRLLADGSASNPTVLVTGPRKPILIDRSGRVLRTIQRIDRVIGWQGGVLYYANEVGEGPAVKLQLRGVTRDGKIDAPVGAVADEILSLENEAFERPEARDLLQRVLFRADRDVMLLKPVPYGGPVPPPPPAGGGDGPTPDEPSPGTPPGAAPGSGDPSDPAGERAPSASATDTSSNGGGGCATSSSPATSSGSSMLLALCALFVVRRRRGNDGSVGR